MTSRSRSFLPRSGQDKASGDERPLVAMVLYAYNEEQYVREAIKSAFAQTYSPLEIVLSDDGSTDGTYAIMEEMAAAYKGPHKILLNRNERNIGIGSQLNAAWQKSKGQLFVLANADDVSLPERAARTVEVWLSRDPRPMAITADLETMDAGGGPLQRVVCPRVAYNDLQQAVMGRCGPVAAASLALDRGVFEHFGPLQPSLIIEDGPLFLRAMLLGPTCHIDKRLVRYRIHKGNISHADAMDEYPLWVKRYRGRVAWQHSEALGAYMQMLLDLCSGRVVAVAEGDLERARWVAIGKMMESYLLGAYYSGNNAVTLRDRFATLCRLAVLMAKLEIKRAIPLIQRRNERWHYWHLRKKHQ